MRYWRSHLGLMLLVLAILLIGVAGYAIGG